MNKELLDQEKKFSKKLEKEAETKEKLEESVWNCQRELEAFKTNEQKVSKSLCFFLFFPYSLLIILFHSTSKREEKHWQVWKKCRFHNCHHFFFFCVCVCVCVNCLDDENCELKFIAT